MKLDSDKLREIAKQYDLTPQQVYDVINSQFEFVAEEIKKPNANSIRIKYLGIFYVEKKRKKYLKEKMLRAGQLKE
jgi:nucleoid DNA-binding protein